MPKPIFIIGIPDWDCNSDDVRQPIESILTKLADDYHILIYPGNNNNFEFNCFFEKDFNEIKFNELKQLILDSLKKEK